MATDGAGAQARSYRPIGDYAIIGDCHGAALIASDGSIDWATLHRFDADPVFCRMLDAGRGGFWSLRPRGAWTSSRAYLPGTNILRTVFSAASGEVAVTDFMPVGRQLDAGVNDYVRLNAPAWIVRRIECLRGTVDMETAYRPSRSFARERVCLAVEPGIVDAGTEMPRLFGDLEYLLEDDTATARWSMTAGDCRDLVLAGSTITGQAPAERVAEFFAVTCAFWTEWISYCRYRGPFEAAVRRSALTLKVLTYAPSGAIVAAPTTSLPETLGGKRNWDYRYCWVRDSSFALYALAVLGYSGEAACFHEFMQRAISRSLPEVRPLYGIDGALDLAETQLDHLEGYAGSSPVRHGNDAYLQRQIDGYGQILDLALMYRALGGKLDRQYRRLLDAVASFIAAHWSEPDQGIWEMRGPPRHHVHGKLMCWVGMDRAARLLGNQWQPVANEIADDIRSRGISAEDGAMLQAYDGGTDAAVLLAPMVGFGMPPGALEATIARVRRTLARGEFFDRYDGEDGLEGEEGAFLVCSSWLIDAELAVGRIDTARHMIEQLVGCGNDVGLYAEEVVPEDGRMLGNFPQALTHLGLIGNVINLQLAQRHGAARLTGSYADRAQAAVSATFGWRGVVSAMFASRRFARIFSSRRSKLAWP